MNRLVLYLIGIVLVGIAGFALLWLGAGHELQSASARILVDLRDGKLEQVYERASPYFRKGRSLEQFEAYWAEMKTRLGTFREIVRRVSLTRPHDEGEYQPRRLVLEVGFQKGAAVGYFEFLAEDAGPRLSHLAFRLLPKVATSEDDRSGLEADVRSLMARYNAGAFTTFYADLGPELQRTWSQHAVIAELAALKSGKAGAFMDLRVLETHDKGPNSVVQVCEAQFEKTTLKLTVTHVHAWDRWEIGGFEIG